MKATAIAPSNIAFIKYWGKIDEKLRIPTNNSISMNLSNLLTTTTVEFSHALTKDDVSIDGEKNSLQQERVHQHLNLIRNRANVTYFAKVVSKNSFPQGTGLSSSASGFAALTVAACHALNIRVTEKQLSILARLGSGSACRSIPDGFVEWLGGRSNETSYAVSLYPSNYWDIVDVVAVVSDEKKDVSTTKGQEKASTSPFFMTRLFHIEKKIRECKFALKEKNFPRFGEIVENEALELHAIMMTSHPSLFYIRPETVQLISVVKHWRNDGLPVYFTLNTGQDVHLICLGKDSHNLVRLLKKESFVKDIIINKPAEGTKLSKNHLF